MTIVASYPEPLRAALIAGGMKPAAFWLGNFHLETALRRADGIYLQSILQQIANGLVHVAFAANRAWFPGEKMRLHLAALPSLPPAFGTRLEAVLLGAGEHGTEAWGERFAAIGAIADELQATVDTPATRRAQ
jgi:hypothetical protein